MWRVIDKKEKAGLFSVLFSATQFCSEQHFAGHCVNIVRSEGLECREGLPLKPANNFKNAEADKRLPYTLDTSEL